MLARTRFAIRDEIRFTQLHSVNPVTARAAMDTEPGKPIDQPTLDRDMRRLYGTGYFEHVNYSFLEEQGRRILVVTFDSAGSLLASVFDGIFGSLRLSSLYW